MFTRRDLTPDEAEYIASVRAGLSGAPAHVRDEAAYYATTLMENGFPVLFSIAHLAFVADVAPHLIGTMAATPSRYYTTFRIPKRSGGSRAIAAPKPELTWVQDWIHTHITSKIEIHPACHGFVRGRSISSNAAPHVGQPLVLKLDIRDFFPSVGRDQVFRSFRRIGYSFGMSDVLTDLTTLDNALPQGAPTSPDLANAAAIDMDFRIGEYASRRHLTYTRYADDLTFTGPEVGAAATRRTIEAIMRDCGFRPHGRKARYLGQATRQLVTGLVVNDRLNWPRERRRWLRQEVYYLTRFGVEEHLQRRGADRTGYKEFIYGHAFALGILDSSAAREHLEALDQVDWPY